MYLAEAFRAIAAYLCAVMGSVVITILSTPLKMWIVPTDLPRGVYTSQDLIFSLFISSLVYIWAGYIILKVSKIKHVALAYGYGLLAFVAWGFGEIEFPLWYTVSSLIISFPSIYLGCRYYKYRAKKVVNFASVAPDCQS